MTSRVALDRFEPIETERLVIRAVESGDVEALHERRNDPSSAAYQSWDTPYPLEHAQALVDEIVVLDGTPPGDGWFQVSVVEKSTGAPGRILGDIAIHFTFDARCAELGWTFAPSARGQGFALEAAEAIARWCIEVVGVSRVSASMHPDNHASARLAERLGMVFEGVAENAFWLDRQDGTAENSHDLRYAMTADQWRAWRDRRRTVPDTVELAALEPDNVREVLALRTHRSQEGLVAPMGVSMADVVGHLLGEGGFIPWPRAVVADGELVGFVLVLEPDEANPDAYLMRLLIDRMHQRRGVGRKVLDAVVDQTRAWGSPGLTVSWMPGPGSPEPFYLGAGFAPTGKVHDGEIQARLQVS